MSSATKVAALCGLAAVSLSACGSTAKPLAGTPQAAVHASHQLNDPRTKHIRCLAKHGIPFTKEYLHGYPSFQVGAPGSGPTVEFLATDGAAQNTAIQGQAQGAEAIGPALLYPNAGSGKLLNIVEKCVEKGVG